MNRALPKIELPTVELPKIDIAGIARDATYVVVGAGVLTFQRAQVARNDLTRQLEDASSAPSKVVALVGDQLKLVEERLGALGEQLGELRDRVASQLS